MTAALSIYLYGVLAVAVLGAAGHDPSDDWTPAQVIDDNLGDQATFYLMALPLMTATIGWAAAAATARLRHARPAIATPGALPTAPGADPTLTGALGTTRPEPQPMREDHPISARRQLGDGVPGATPSATTRQRRTWYLLMLCAALAAAAFLVFLAFLRH